MTFFEQPRLWHGADYNPEQWRQDPGVLEEDIRLMVQAGLNIVSVGIFSWSDLEPAEREYEFGWLDGVMDRLAAAGIRAALATPSAAPPPWMAVKYPEILRADERGQRRRYGVRQQHCLTSPLYREKTAAFNRLLAERYKDHPALALWHVSNEYGGECYCPHCRQEFRRWLRERYHDSVAELNDAWWGSFWSHRYTDFEQIDPPSSLGENLVSGQNLDFKRFVSDCHIAFFDNEIAPLRELTPHIPVTANLMNTYPGIDYQAFARHMDIVSWDNYPTWHRGDNARVAQQTAFIHDIYRGMKDGQPFLVMESTPSQVNWHGVNKLQRPGMLRLSALQGLAHGADSMQYFQWRKGRGSHEKYHGAVVDHVGHPRTRTFREVSEVGAMLSRLQGLAGVRKESPAALIYDWENEWAIRGMNGFNNERRTYQPVCERYHAPLWQAGVSTVCIGEEQDFTPYRLLVAPMLYMLKDRVARRLADFVAAGGDLVLTYMSGMADSHDLCHLGGFPGEGLRQVCGVWVEETDALYEEDRQSVSFGGTSYPVRRTCDIIHAEGARVLATYERDFYAGTPAVTCSRYGKGRAWYVGFDDDGAFTSAFMEGLIRELDLPRPLKGPIPRGVSVQQRGERIFLLNFLDSPAALPLERPYLDELTGGRAEGEALLPPFGAMVLIPV